ncbi:hypothetical protein DL95DRAFT_159469 [Leptodontidium sp. 2 PMI_412]|nr:hypothetical protein DL95DRAFT_159469 [Leptodontidium sp. 2 PMI_412]
MTRWWVVKALARGSQAKPTWAASVSASPRFILLISPAWSTIPSKPCNSYLGQMFRSLFDVQVYAQYIKVIQSPAGATNSILSSKGTAAGQSLV